MEYNTTREKLIYPEYGRNIQKLVKKINIIKDLKLKNKEYKNIVNLIYNIKKKKISNYIQKKKIYTDIYNLLKGKTNNNEIKPVIKTQKKINKSYINYKYYGYNIHNILKKIKKLSKIKLIYLYNIANYMKKNYLKWNKMKYIETKIIYNDIKKITKGKINILNFIS
ncbi:MAG: DUF4290 domain-containing protein [Candidatus Shikimatogenerans sp. JK-2022]|nr:DUF4290 domain-containing protein [Candidatus Shikimatogenerans bostrichidophilus]